MMLRKPCEHDLYDSHSFERRPLPGEEFTFEELVVLGWHVCPGGTEPTLQELIEEAAKLRALLPAPYDIEIPDFVNRMDEMPHGKSFHDEEGNRPDFVNRVAPEEVNRFGVW